MKVNDCSRLWTQSESGISPKTEEKIFRYKGWNIFCNLKGLRWCQVFGKIMWVVHVASGMEIIQIWAIVATLISLYQVIHIQFVRLLERENKAGLVLNDSK